MKKSFTSMLILGLLSTFAISLSSCGDQKIVQQVTIDKSLLEVLQGKSAATTAKPGETPSPTVSHEPSITPSPRSTTGSSEEQAIIDVIKANGQALNNQDLNAFSITLHPQSQFTTYMPNLFYLLVQAQTRYSFNDIVVESQDGTNASVFVDRSTSDISGTIQQAILYTLRKSGSSWKIFFMAVDN